MYAPNEIVWRFEHEDAQDNRFCIRSMQDMERIKAHRAYTITRIVEDWADNEHGSWEDGDLLTVIVLWPVELAGTYHCSMAKRTSVYVYDKTPEDA